MTDDIDSIRPEYRVMHVRAACINYIGRVRQSNEDCLCANEFYIAPEEMNSNISCFQERDCRKAFYAVFDGVGADLHGEIASCTAAQFFSSHRQHLFQACTKPDEMTAFYRQANAAVCSAAKGSCTTAAVLCLLESQAFVSNIGDSQAFLYRSGILRELTVRHNGPSLGNRRSNIITRYFGGHERERRFVPALSPSFPLEHDDLFILCSDGITDLVDEQTLQMILLQNKSENKMASDIVNCAACAGGTDNATIIVIRVHL